MNLCSAAQYERELELGIDEARDHIFIASMMMLADSETTERILLKLIAATTRGVKVTVIVDAYIRLFGAKGAVALIGNNAKILQRTLSLLHELELGGGEVVVTGKLGMNPYRGRYHIKASVIDDMVYSFGGVNMYGEAFHNIDYMLGSDDMELAAKVESLSYLAAKATTVPNSKKPINSQSAMLLDGGEPRNSIIYDEAMALAREAREVIYVSQFAPSGELAMILKGRATRYFYNRPEQASFPANVSILFDQARFGIRNEYKKSEYLHAKCLLFTLKDGKRAILSGSHNFSWRGVAYGTKEIALLSYDSELYDSLFDFIDTNVI